MIIHSNTKTCSHTWKHKFYDLHQIVHAITYLQDYAHKFTNTHRYTCDHTHMLTHSITPTCSHIIHLHEDALKITHVHCHLLILTVSYPIIHIRMHKYSHTYTYSYMHTLTYSFRCMLLTHGDIFTVPPQITCSYSPWNSHIHSHTCIHSHEPARIFLLFHIYLYISKLDKWSHTFTHTNMLTSLHMLRNLVIHMKMLIHLNTNKFTLIHHTYEKVHIFSLPQTHW